MNSPSPVPGCGRRRRGRTGRRSGRGSMLRCPCPRRSTVISTACPRPRLEPDRGARRRVLDRVLDQLVDDLAKLVRVGQDGLEHARPRSTANRWPLAAPAAPRPRPPRAASGPMSVGASSTSSVPVIEPRHVQQRVDDAREALGLGRDVAEERLRARSSEKPMSRRSRVWRSRRWRSAASRSSCETVETKSDFICSTTRSAEMSRNAKMRPATAPDRVAHDRLRQREPHLLAAAQDRNERGSRRRAPNGARAGARRPGSRPIASGAAMPVMRSAAAFQRTTRPSRSTATIPSATLERIAALCSCSSASRW